MRPSDMAIELKKESDLIISNALQGKPPPHLKYAGNNNNNNNNNNTNLRNITNARSIQSKISIKHDDDDDKTMLDMPNIGDLVAVRLNGWSKEYIGKVIHNRNIEKEYQNERTKTAEIFMRIPNLNNKRNATIAKNKYNSLSNILWTIDVLFDDFELFVDQEWNKETTCKNIIDINVTHIVPLIESRLQQYKFMKNVWLTRQKQEKQEKQKKQERQEKQETQETQDKQENDTKKRKQLSWDQQKKYDRRISIKKFKETITKGKQWFELPVELDEFGFPIPQWSDEEEEEENDDDVEPPSFCILR